MKTAIINTASYQSPAGEMIIGSLGDGLCMCDWAGGKGRAVVDRRIQRHFNAVYEQRKSSVIKRTIGALDEYFAGERRAFDIPLVFAGTKFQCAVWAELMRIPYGATVSYGELARRVGSPGAVRAVASACAANPMSVIVPCHRVVGRDSRLTGYRGGIGAKRRLLELESRAGGASLFA